MVFKNMWRKEEKKGGWKGQRWVFYVILREERLNYFLKTSTRLV